MIALVFYLAFNGENTREHHGYQNRGTVGVETTAGLLDRGVQSYEIHPSFKPVLRE